MKTPVPIEFGAGIRPSRADQIVLGDTPGIGGHGIGIGGHGIGIVYWGTPPEVSLIM